MQSLPGCADPKASASGIGLQCRPHVLVPTWCINLVHQARDVQKILKSCFQTPPSCPLSMASYGPHRMCRARLLGLHMSCAAAGVQVLLLSGYSHALQQRFQAIAHRSVIMDSGNPNEWQDCSACAWQRLLSCPMQQEMSLHQAVALIAGADARLCRPRGGRHVEMVVVRKAALPQGYRASLLPGEIEAKKASFPAPQTRLAPQISASCALHARPGLMHKRQADIPCMHTCAPQISLAFSRQQGCQGELTAQELCDLLNKNAWKPAR